jgi:hypothetical protein
LGAGSGQAPLQPLLPEHFSSSLQLFDDGPAAAGFQPSSQPAGRGQVVRPPASAAQVDFVPPWIGVEW